MLLLPPPDAVVTLEALARLLGLPSFDLLLVGDGSGTVYHQPSGWACVAYDRNKGQVKIHTGAASMGTNNFAELAPYVQALWYHQQEHPPEVEAPTRVCIVSDSELTVKCGNGVYARRANGCLWASIEYFERNGYRITWRHVPRNSNPWNARMDALAGESRKLMVNAFLPEQEPVCASCV